MKNDFNHIDEFYRKVLKNHAQKASVFTWTKLRWHLFWMSYSRYVLGIGAATVIALGVYFLTATGDNDPQSSHAEYLVTEQVQATGYAENEPAMPESPENKTLLSATVNENSPDASAERPKHVPATTGNTDAKNNVTLSASNASFSKKLKAPETPDEPSVTEATVMYARQEIFSIDQKDLTIDALTAKKEALAVLDTILITKIPADVRPKKNWVSIGFYLSPAYTAYTLKADENHQEYLQYRKDHESPAVSVSGGLDIRVNIGNGFIQTGLEYSEFRQYRNYNNSFMALDSLNSYYRTDTIWGWYYDPPDIAKPIILGYDTVFVPIYNTTNEGYNIWKYLEIPLTGGYKFNRGRFAFEVATGFSCGFLLDAQGNVPDLTDENRFTELNDMKNEMNKYLFNYILQVGFTYHITPAWSLNLSPFYKQNLNSVFKNNYPVDQKFRSFGINFGLKVDL